jgi:threonine synthase
LKPSDTVVLFNTGSGNKYTDVLAEAFGLIQKPAPLAAAPLAMQQA